MIDTNIKQDFLFRRHSTRRISPEISDHHNRRQDSADLDPAYHDTRNSTSDGARHFSSRHWAYLYIWFSCSLIIPTHMPDYPTHQQNLKQTCDSISNFNTAIKLVRLRRDTYHQYRYAHIRFLIMRYEYNQDVYIYISWASIFLQTTGKKVPVTPQLSIHMHVHYIVHHVADWRKLRTNEC